MDVTCHPVMLRWAQEKQLLASLLLQKTFALREAGCHPFSSSGDLPVPSIDVDCGWPASTRLLTPTDAQWPQSTPCSSSCPAVEISYSSMLPRVDSNSEEIKSWECKWTGFPIAGVWGNWVITSSFFYFSLVSILLVAPTTYSVNAARNLGESLYFSSLLIIHPFWINNYIYPLFPRELFVLVFLSFDLDLVQLYSLTWATAVPFRMVAPSLFFSHLHSYPDKLPRYLQCKSDYGSTLLKPLTFQPCLA